MKDQVPNTNIQTLTKYEILIDTQGKLVLELWLSFGWWLLGFGH